MLTRALNPRYGLIVLSVGSAVGILLGYFWSAQYWNPIAHIATKNITGTMATTGFVVALFVALVFGCMRTLMGCSNIIVFALPHILGSDRSPGKWASNISSFAIGAVVTGAVIGACVGLFGSALIGVLNSFSAKVSVAAITQAAIGVLILGLAVIEYRSMSFPIITTNFRPRRPFFMGVVLGGIANLGCPSPIFYGLLAWIVATGNLVEGALILAVHSVGRILPVATFGTILVSGVGYEKVERWAVDYRDQMRIVSATGLAMLGTFLISYWFVFLEQKFPTPH